MVLGFARWGTKEGAKKLLKSKKGGVEVISAVRPGTKFKGQKTVQEQKNLTSRKQFKSAMEDFRTRITGKLNKTAKELDKLNKTLKKQKKILDE